MAFAGGLQQGPLPQSMQQHLHRSSVLQQRSCQGVCSSLRHDHCFVIISPLMEDALQHRIPVADRPTLVLRAEEELGITAGLQDRVAQVYGGLVYMDFARESMQRHGHGR